MRLLLLFPLVLLLSGCEAELGWDTGRESEDFSFNFPLRGDGRITLETYNGSVEITAWEQDKIEIRGRKYAPTAAQLAGVRVEASALGPDRVAIRTLPPPERPGHTGARFTIRVPRRTTVERLVTSNGAVRLEGLAGPGRVQTSNGAIRVERHEGRLELTTVNGAIDLSEITGTVTAKTSNGRVSVEELSGGLDASTSNGSVTINLRRAPRDDLRARTTNGSVTLRMPEGSEGRIALSTSNATIRNEFPLANGDAIATKTHLEGKIGNGGPLLDIPTTNGSIGLLRSSR